MQEYLHRDVDQMPRKVRMETAAGGSHLGWQHFNATCGPRMGSESALSGVIKWIMRGRGDRWIKVGAKQVGETALGSRGAGQIASVTSGGGMLCQLLNWSSVHLQSECLVMFVDALSSQSTLSPRQVLVPRDLVDLQSIPGRKRVYV